MTLIERLRWENTYLTHEAADRIEELEAELRKKGDEMRAMSGLICDMTAEFCCGED